jgi:hypothetical protein
MGRPKGTQGIECTCKTCGVTFREWPYRLAANGGQYCGTKCWSIDHTITSFCRNCDKRISIPKSETRSPLGQKYCDNECRSEAARKRLPMRFWAKVHKTETCWLFMGLRTKFGYGEFHVTARQPVGAHRVAWILTHGGPIPQGIYVCHTCDVPACVNPAHLYLGTPTDNARDVVVRGRRKPRVVPA